MAANRPEFRRARREKVWLRLLVYGASGTGKTLGSLKLAEQLGGRVALIDAEPNGPAHLYADIVPFDHLVLPDGEVETYIEALTAAYQAGYDVLIVDSITQEWEDLKAWKDALDVRNAGKTNFSGWGPAGERHKLFVRALLDYPGHLIATARAGEKHVQVDEGGKAKIVRVGMEPETRKGTMFEFDLCAELAVGSHEVWFRTSRCCALDDASFPRLWEPELVQTLTTWLNAGDEPAPRPPREREPERPATNGDGQRNGGGDPDDAKQAQAQARRRLYAELKDVENQSDLERWESKLRDLLANGSVRRDGSNHTKFAEGYLDVCKRLDLRPLDDVLPTPKPADQPADEATSESDEAEVSVEMLTAILVDHFRKAATPAALEQAATAFQATVESDKRFSTETAPWRTVAAAYDEARQRLGEPAGAGKGA